MKLIETKNDHCHECFACVRNCPVKAVLVKDGQAEVVADRCIHCASCVLVCSQGAKQINDQTEKAKKLLQQNRRVIVGLAPSFPSFIPGMSLFDWQQYLSQIGFAQLYEVAFGAELMLAEYEKILAENDDKLLISSACPAIVNYVEKYFPQFIENLVPVVSPMQALSRYLEKVESSAELVMVGPCHAKKSELCEESGVTAVLTFQELVKLGKELVGIVPENDNFKSNKLAKQGFPLGIKPTQLGRQIPLAGGIINALHAGERKDYISVEGKDKVLALFKSLDEGEIKVNFIDILFCEGCISGIDLSNIEYFRKREAVKNFANLPLSTKKYNQNVELDLRKKFDNDYQYLPMPSDAQIWQVLKQTGKEKEDDLLNCSACGYQSCREKAVAVCQGLAEVEMCLPYLLSQKRHELNEVQRLHQELDAIINASYDGLLVIDNNGMIIKINQAYLKMLGFSREEIVGKNIIDLEKEKILYPAVSLLTLHERRNISLVQNTQSGKRLLVTGRPLLDSQDNLVRVIVNARDLKELNQFMDQNNYISDSEEFQLEFTGAEFDQMIAVSDAMKKIIRLADRVAPTDSTILITGESGVGKEVVAHYIDQKSKRKGKFVKINCAAIPETLLESELFGYETGAFSGAQRNGKVGLIETAKNGTLFLDEIGEMSVQMQAKLLQVLQDHQLTRIGGTEPLKVDFRLIAATNRDLLEMVREKEFREDLYYRINVVPIYIPPLRERRTDIIPLFNYFKSVLEDKYNKNIILEEVDYQLLKNYYWPGNVRQITNMLERLIVTSNTEKVEHSYLKELLNAETHVPLVREDYFLIKEIIPLSEAIAELEKCLLRLAEKECNSTYQMAEKLGVNQSTVVRKFKKYFN